MSLFFGDPLPPFSAAGTANPDFVFSSVAGRYVLLVVLSGAEDAEIRRAVALMTASRAGFDDVHASLFGPTPRTGADLGRRSRTALADRRP